MAQLRDKKTSQFIAEGSPLEMAVLASRLGFDEVLFDDVGEGFDPQNMLDVYNDTLDVIKDDDSVPEEHKESTIAAGEVTDKAVKAASAAIDEARAQLDEE